MRRALQTASLVPLRTHRPPYLSVCAVLRRQLQTKLEPGSQERISKYSIEYLRQMADKEKVSMTDHSQIEELIAAKEGEWERQPEMDVDGNPMFIMQMMEYAKISEDAWDAIQAQYLYLNRRSVSADAKPEGRNALHWCTPFPSLSPMMQWLLEDGSIDPNEWDNEKFTALHYAVMYSNIECVSVLLNDKRVDKDYQHTYGLTPLGTAVLRRNPEMVSLLLKHGCNKDIRNTQGLTALMIAEQKGYTELISLLKS